MKIAFCTVASNGYIVFLDHLLKSILKHNPDFNYDFYVFYSDYGYNVLDKQNHVHLKKLYPNIKMSKIDYALYDKYGKVNPKFFSFESFKLNEYDKVVFLDSDLLCLQSLDEFFEDIKNVETIGMVREMRRGCFNGGLIVIDKKYLLEKIYSDLITFNHHFIAYRNVFGNDQKVYNIYFKNIIEPLDAKYNMFVAEGLTSKTVFAHYIHKPNSIVARKKLSSSELKHWDVYDNPEGRYKELIG